MEPHLEIKTYAELEYIKELKGMNLNRGINLPGLLFGFHSSHQVLPLNPQAWRNAIWKPFAFDQGSANYDLQAKLGPLPHLFVYVLPVSSRRKELSSCHRDHIVHKAKNMYYLALVRKSLLTSTQAKRAPSLFPAIIFYNIFLQKYTCKA